MFEDDNQPPSGIPRLYHAGGGDADDNHIANHLDLSNKNDHDNAAALPIEYKVASTNLITDFNEIIPVVK